MYRTFFISIFWIAGIIIISCDSDSNSLDTKKITSENANKITIESLITDFGFNPDHPGSEQYQFLLNNFKEKILPTEIDWTKRKHEDLIQERFSFRTSESDMSLLIIFCANQKDCITICKANFPTTPNLMWGVNGAVAFAASGENEYELNELIGYLAGEE